MTGKNKKTSFTNVTQKVSKSAKQVPLRIFTLFVSIKDVKHNESLKEYSGEKG